MNYLDDPNYCPLFFKGMFTWVDGTNAHVGHCCVSGISNNIPVPDFYHPYLEQTRRTWSAGPRADCKQCWETEQRGYTSDRQYHVTWIKDLKLDPVAPELLRLDFAVGAVCNAKCIMCNAGSSTTWAAEDFKFGIKKYQHQLKSNGDIEQVAAIDVSKLKQVYFTGGEPFMSHRLLELLKHVEQTGTISELEFSCNTNGSILPSDEVFDLLSRCKSANVYFSIDGTGREFEYIRNPLKWHEVEANINKFKSKGIGINIAVTVGVHNIDIMPDIYEWFRSLNLPDTALGINPCWGALGLDSAAESLKAIWRKQLQNIKQPWAEVVQSMLTAPGQASNFKWESLLNTIDRRRNLKWQVELPALAATKNKASLSSL